MGPGDKVIMANQKERQGDFVFTAQDIGEYRVCFDNDMSTFTDKMVDFEIAVCQPLTPFLHSKLATFWAVKLAQHTLSSTAIFDMIISNRVSTGRKRTPHHPPHKARNHSRTNERGRRRHLQALELPFHHQSHAEVLPNKRKPELQHGQEYREADIQFFDHGVGYDGCHGRVASFHRAVLFPRCKER